jgi:glycosyltransferase involved in cell wall biosynthesis
MISICLATYNGEIYISEQLNSLLPYMNVDDELIISDDGSSDSTVFLLENIRDNRIKIFRNNFSNSTLNFEFLIKQASGDKIFLCDQDDIWFPEKIGKVSKLLDENFDLVITDCDIINNNYEVLNSSFFYSNNSKNGLVHNFFHNSYMGCCMAFNRNIIPYILPFPKYISNYRVVHDYWIGMVSQFFFNVYFFNEVLIHHRKHDFNASNTSSGVSNLNLFKKIMLRIFIFFFILKAFFKNKIFKK